MADNDSLTSVSALAPWYRISKKRQVVSVEHPCVVENVEKAIETLGGDKAISEFVKDEHADKPVSLRLHPEDHFSQLIPSVNRRTENILLEITVPKRTGRKRKRGSAGPFVGDAGETLPKKSARYFLRSLHDHQSSYQVEPVACISTVHVFRSMPDLIYSSSNSKFLSKLRDHILPQQYPLLSGFHLSSARGLEDTEIIQPSALSTLKYSHNYAYRQNPAIKAFIDPSTGARRLYNTQAPATIWTYQTQWNVPSSQIPAAINPAANSLELEHHNFRGLVTILHAIFARRPIWTRRGLCNQFPANSPLFLAKYAIAYVAYSMRSGPWRDTYIKFGVDPRSDKGYRKYQTLMLQLVSNKKSHEENKKYEDVMLRSWKRDPNKESHIFTGQGEIPLDGKIWQLCDLHDPVLKQLVDIPDLYIRGECEARYFGWYLNGTWCKLKIILRAKIDILQDAVNNYPDMGVKFDKIMGLPDEYVFPDVPDEELSQLGGDKARRTSRRPWQAAGYDGDPLLGFLPRDSSRQELEWAALYRALCRTPQGKLPASARLSKSKPQVRTSYLEALSEGGYTLEGHNRTGSGGQSTLDHSPNVTREDGKLGAVANEDHDLYQKTPELELEDEEGDEGLELDDGDEEDENNPGDFQDLTGESGDGDDPEGSDGS